VSNTTLTRLGSLLLALVLISLAAWRTDALPRWLNALGIIAGALLIRVLILLDPIWLIGPSLIILYALAVVSVREATADCVALQL